MKKSVVSGFVIAGLLSVLLCGCQAGGGVKGDMPGVPEDTESMEGKSANTGKTDDERIDTGSTDTGSTDTGSSERCESAESKSTDRSEDFADIPYQFARNHGIIQSEHPIYDLDTGVDSKIIRGEQTLAVSSAICQNKELIISIILDDYSKAEVIAADGETLPEYEYEKLSDGTMITSGRYQNELWLLGEGVYLTGPGLPKEGIKPQDSLYMRYPGYYEAYGNRRYFIEAKFELPASCDQEEDPPEYGVRVLDFEKPVEFALKRVPVYESLEELAKGEHGGMAAHDGVSVISMAEKVKEGLLISWYVFMDEEGRGASVTYRPPDQEVDEPYILGENQYPIKWLSIHPFWDTIGRYRLSEVSRVGGRTRCLFDVPPTEQNAPLELHIPGITFLNREESEPVTLPVPEDYETLDEVIPWKDGSVRILGITRMKEPQAVEGADRGKNGKGVTLRPGVYIDVEAVHEDKDLTLRGLICQRKLKWNGWEHERYDFDGNGRLSGFRILYDEGDREVTLKFHGAAFYWKQPFVMEIPLTD